MRRIYPPAVEGDIDLDDLYGATRPAPPDRPWVGVCMIAGLDGSTSVDGRSGSLGNANDAAIFAALRRAADHIIVGASTVAAEHYRPPRRPGQRIGVVTGSGRVDVATDLFRSGAGFLIMAEDGPATPPGVDVLRAGRGSVDLATALARLGDVADPARFVQAEGGARLNGSLLDAGCVDELNFSLAPLMTGGDGSRLTRDATEAEHEFELAHVVVDEDSYLFTRWVRRSGT